MTDDILKDSRDVLEFIRARIKAYRAELARLETAERALASGNPGIYAGKRLYIAIEDVLKKKDGPATDEEILSELQEGGASLGHEDPMAQVRKSLTHQVNSGRLRTTEEGKYELANYQGTGSGTSR